jgi:putative RNA 2'-phosphotransferase
MDEHGWVSVEELLSTQGARKRGLTRPLLRRVVAENDKQRFEFDLAVERIRARQGHSRTVDLDLKAVAPPQYLYHGTSSRAIPSIREAGLQRRSRQHVHLSPDVATARKVGSRHGPPVVLTVRSGEMHDVGHEFFLSGNGIWLVESVPLQFIEFPQSDEESRH